MEANRKTRPSEPTEQGTHELTEPEAATTALRGFVSGPLCIDYSQKLRVYMGLITVRGWKSPTLLSALGTLVLLLGCHVQLRYYSFCLILYFTLLGLVVISQKPVFLLKRDRERVDQEEKGVGKKLGRVEGGEAIIRIYCMRKESIRKKLKSTNKSCYPLERKLSSQLAEIKLIIPSMLSLQVAKLTLYASLFLELLKCITVKMHPVLSGRQASLILLSLRIPVSESSQAQCQSSGIAAAMSKHRALTLRNLAHFIQIKFGFNLKNNFIQQCYLNKCKNSHKHSYAINDQSYGYLAPIC